MRTIAILVVGILMFFGGLLSGVLLLPTMMTSNTTLAVQENWDFTNVTSSQGANGWIAITVNNTGIVPVTFVKASVNLVAQSTSPSLPLTLQPDTGTVLNITMNVDYAQYYVRVYTSRGNYSEIRWAPTFIFMATEQLKITNIRFGPAQTMINVTMMNTGTSPITVTEIHVNNGNNLLNAPFTVLANSNYVENVTYTGSGTGWTNGAQYEIETRSSKGNQFTYSATAPT
jgi:hypothetical protein